MNVIWKIYKSNIEIALGIFVSISVTNCATECCRSSFKFKINERLFIIDYYVVKKIKFVGHIDRSKWLKMRLRLLVDNASVLTWRMVLIRPTQAHCYCKASDFVWNWFCPFGLHAALWLPLTNMFVYTNLWFQCRDYRDVYELRQGRNRIIHSFVNKHVAVWKRSVTKIWSNLI